MVFHFQECRTTLDDVAGATLFSNFDLTSGYFQITLKTVDIPKSTFYCKFGHYEMTRMPFGLKNACSTFQRTMGLQWITCLINIVDIIVFGSNFEEHISRVDEVLDIIQKTGLKLKPKKCNLLQTKVVFLGPVVSKEGFFQTQHTLPKYCSGRHLQTHSKSNSLSQQALTITVLLKNSRK